MDVEHKIICRTLAVIGSVRTLDQLLTAERYAKLAVRRIKRPLFGRYCENALNAAFHRVQAESRAGRRH